MIVSALVLTLTSEPAQRAQTLTQLAADARLMVGEAVNNRLPVVAEADSAADGAALVEELCSESGVIQVDVVAIDFGEAA